MHSDQNILFNEKLADFVNRMIVVNPSVKDFKVFLKSCEFITNIDHRLPMQIFKYCVTDPYRDQINKRDESFFLNESYDEYGNIMNIYGYSFDLINRFKTLWCTYSDKEKNEIWNYLTLLCNLSSNSNLDLVKQINMNEKVF